jgi:predicted signal transduction protein with EAL and GGDEF domain
VFTTASIGVALSSTNYQRPADLLRDANIAMYRAKAQGRGRYAVFDRAMHDDILRLSLLENDLRQDVEKIGQLNTPFHLYYQPIVSLAAGRISSFEALIRWQHPKRLFTQPILFHLQKKLD